MRNELWKVITGLFPEEEWIKQLDFSLATNGSPYDETVKIEQQQVFVNPYLRYGEVLEALLSDSDFLNSGEGKLLFQEAMALLLDIDRYRGCDGNFFLKRLIEKEVLDNCLGEEIRRFYLLLTVEEQKRTLENILFFYQTEQTVFTFVRQITALFPHSLLFQEKDKPDLVYIYMGVPKTREIQWKIEKCKDLFLRPDIQVHIAWEKAFLVTDMQILENTGKYIV